MAKILITSGPTRQYLDPVRYLTNASSGRMGAALARSAIALGHEIVIVSGPVSVSYPEEAQVIPVTTTQEMLQVAHEQYEYCEGAIGAAAPCDYQPKQVQSQKISKSGKPIELQLIETPDVVATLGQRRREDQWLVGFALETTDRRFRAIVKLEKKHCDLIVSNGPEAIDSDCNEVELIISTGEVIRQLSGSKEVVAQGILSEIDTRFIRDREHLYSSEVASSRTRG